jgi:7-cyano-7-deazaguanine synthase
MEEAGAFSDNDPEFIRKFNELLPNAVAEGKSIYVAEPVGNYVKHEIVKLGLELGAPIEHSWSCYENYDQPCNNCGPCNLKRKAFEMNGYELSEDQKQWRVK